MKFILRDIVDDMLVKEGSGFNSLIIKVTSYQTPFKFNKHKQYTDQNNRIWLLSELDDTSLTLLDITDKKTKKPGMKFIPFTSVYSIEILNDF